MAVIGIIGGNGWLGRALARPALETGALSPDRLIVSCRSGVTDVYDQWPGVRVTADNQGLVEASDIVVLSVRPDQFDAVTIRAGDRLVVSLMAGRGIDFIGSRTGATRIIRAMPNAAAEIGLSFTPWCASAAVTAEDRNQVAAFLAASGREVEVPQESQIDYFTGLTGSGPAFPALLADSMQTHAIARGIDPEIARLAVSTLLSGAARLLETEDFAATVKAFRDYRGTTAAGIEAMLGAGLDHAIAAGLDAAEQKAADMAAQAKP